VSDGRWTRAPAVGKEARVCWREGTKQTGKAGEEGKKARLSDYRRGKTAEMFQVMARFDGEDGFREATATPGNVARWPRWLLAPPWRKGPRAWGVLPTAA